PGGLLLHLHHTALVGSCSVCSAVEVFTSHALPVLPQPPGPSSQHGPGPPSLILSCPCSTDLLDCFVFGASASHSLGGTLS
ncbi:hypothetical protein M9458_046910, partial [Cirrhinus mrigala]